jgi:hypothetical protein
MIPGFKPRKKKAREAPIQKAVVEYARERHKGKLIAIKRQSGKFGSNGYPDYEFLIVKGRSFHIEFKAPGEACTELQLQRHAELRAIGHTVYVTDSVPAGRAIVDKEMATARAA